jgi:hypothetical protein
VDIIAPFLSGIFVPLTQEVPITIYIFTAYYVGAMGAASVVPKALGASICFCVGLSVVYPDTSLAAFLLMFYVPFVLLSAFRD